MDALSVENLCVKVSGRHLIENVTFSVEKGAIVAIIGPNGAGKTTLLKAILGLIPYDVGTISIFGRPLKNNNSGINVGYVPQRLEFDRTVPLTVSELLDFTVPPVYSFPFYRSREKKEYVNSLLALVGVQHLAERAIGSLSGGELQRVMIAKAIVNDPQVLFLDEPASGVDIEGQEKFYDLVTRLNKEKGLTVILISHDLNVVYRFADKVLCMNRRLICTGKPREALTDEVIKSVYGEMMGGYMHSCHEHDH
ncbi:MAG TPA: metal ABC transporter ATP-binding protein [Nitrospirae bacterium]|nr:zinc import ATP-binding protein ZnuC [bacterium BMS3Abin10]GBE37981.1 zinc import ATP-binding protein ZnuC [bacterium BMS3Bbin08]HDH51089.1 metal ABC transporter ATP-binding protein [Nitrospirota bacterium]HDK17466.1 metal ABC transporter ATP-binding protein [Nitrospirota bacterium]HDK82304.1 metal ABC transporter ATP-binding protein [Nitrospirota bacterium]